MFSFIKIIESQQRKLNSKNKIPLHYAALGRNSLDEIFKLLISKGADKNNNEVTKPLD